MFWNSRTNVAFCHKPLPFNLDEMLLCLVFQAHTLEVDRHTYYWLSLSRSGLNALQRNEGLFKVFYGILNETIECLRRTCLEKRTQCMEFCIEPCFKPSPPTLTNRRMDARDCVSPSNERELAQQAGHERLPQVQAFFCSGSAVVKVIISSV